MTVNRLLGGLIDDTLPIVSVQLGTPATDTPTKYRDIQSATALALSVIYPEVEFWFFRGLEKVISKAGKIVTHKILPESVT